jgi:hypothetical protein
MASISIFLDSIGHGTGGTVRLSGTVLVDGGEDPLSWEVYVSFTALAASINDAIKTAAIEVVEAETEFTVGVLDKKTLYSGAVGL